MAVKVAHQIVKNDAIITKSAAGATIATRTVISVLKTNSGTTVKFNDGSSKIYRRGERVYL